MATVKQTPEERQHHSWGLLVQGRPATPSEGRAQQYTRIGPKDSQSLITHNNGTCLEFGPWDMVDEFHSGSPFTQQVLLIDTTIKDIQSVRVRHNDVVGDEEDVFKGFRTHQYTGEPHVHQYPNGETYNQVPSYYASVSSTPSMYSTSNKSDVIGAAHPGLSSDTRFGVLVPSQNQSYGRGTGIHQRQGGTNRYHGERGGYAQHLNRRGRRDMHFGRGQGRSDGRGHHGDGRGDAYRGRHNASSAQNGYPQQQEFEVEQGRRWDEADRQDSQITPQRGQVHPDEMHDPNEERMRHFGFGNTNHLNPLPSFRQFPRTSRSRYTMQAPVYPGFEEANPLIPPPLSPMSLPPLPYFQGTQIHLGHLGYFGPFGDCVPGYSLPASSDVYEYARNIGIGTLEYAPMETMRSPEDGHSPYFIRGNDVGVAVPMGPDQGRMPVVTRPLVVVPPSTPEAARQNVNHTSGQGFLRASVHPPTPFRPSPGRSPMRTTTDQGSPLMRPRRHATDPITSFTPLSHDRTSSGSVSDLRRLVTAQSGFTIAEPRSSPITGAFSPAPGSDGLGNMNSTTARSSPGLSLSTSRSVSNSMARTASSHELTYVGFSIDGQHPGVVSGPPTPFANSGRQSFENRSYFTDASRFSSPGMASPERNSGFFADSRSEDGQM